MAITKKSLIANSKSSKPASKSTQSAKSPSPVAAAKIATASRGVYAKATPLNTTMRNLKASPLQTTMRNLKASPLQTTMRNLKASPLQTTMRSLKVVS